MSRRVALLVLGFLSALILIESSKDYLSARLHGRPEPFLWVLLGSIEWWGTWALLAPLCALLVKHVRFKGRRLAPAVLHLLGGLLICGAHLLIAGAAFYTTHGRGHRGGVFRQVRLFFENYVMFDLLTYLTLIGGCVAMGYYRRYREEERRAAALLLQAERLKVQMAEAQLQALRMELHPHFLFNTLNAACGLVRRRDHDAAVRVIERLAELLRATLERGAEAEVPLARELELLSAYLEIEHTRFHDRLTVEQHVEEAARSALLPPLLLQPIVENAVRHGVARVPGPGRVEVRARVQGGALCLEVEDSGPGFPAGAVGVSEGIGLSNTRARLAQMYGDAATLHLENLPGRGARVRINLPLRGQHRGGGDAIAAHPERR